MLKTLWFFIVVTAIVSGIVWLIDHPGDVVLNWQSYQVRMDVGVLLAGMVVIALITAVCYRFWRGIKQAPSKVSGALKNRRRQQGYNALTRGMVAVAAGDGGEAKRQVKRADVLLNEPPLTLLLSAQTAQLNGDDKAASRFFEAMRENPETEFLGLRGLLNQALKTGHNQQALELAREAYRLRPKSDWVVDTLFDLQTRNGKWLDARITADERIKAKRVDSRDGKHIKAVLALQSAIEADGNGDRDSAFRQLKTAVDLDPGLVPAGVMLARMWCEKNRAKKAVQLIEKAWAVMPHPDYVTAYYNAFDGLHGAADGMGRYRAAVQLAKANTGHIESDICVAAAALQAELWGECRSHLQKYITGDNPPEARICHLMAELEEREHGDMDKARSWLVRASHAPAGAAWVCRNCGNTVSDWSVNCGNCHQFDAYEWGPPPHVSAALVSGKGSSAGPLALVENKYNNK